MNTVKTHQLLLIFQIFFAFSCTNTQGSDTTSSEGGPNYDKIKNKAEEALQFCEEKNYNTNFCVLIDVSIHSGLKRLFIYNFNNEEIEASYTVSHGCGNNPWSSDASKTNPCLSNEDGSHCSSKGKYKIGERGYSNWGVRKKYLLHGLENSNRNALKRTIVFHSWDAISDEEVYPNGTPEGWGCPAVSNNSFNAIDPLLRQSNQPVLMWIFD